MIAADASRCLQKFRDTICHVLSSSTTRQDPCFGSAPVPSSRIIDEWIMTFIYMSYSKISREALQVYGRCLPRPCDFSFQASLLSPVTSSRGSLLRSANQLSISVHLLTDDSLFIIAKSSQSDMSCGGARQVHLHYRDSVNPFIIFCSDDQFLREFGGDLDGKSFQMRDKWFLDSFPYAREERVYRQFFLQVDRQTGRWVFFLTEPVFVVASKHLSRIASVGFEFCGENASSHHLNQLLGPSYIPASDSSQHRPITLEVGRR